MSPRSTSGMELELVQVSAVPIVLHVRVAKVAVTLLVAVMATVQVVLDPVQAPDQPSKLQPVLFAAVSVTLVP
jgi:hypothetical protein